MLCWDLWDNLRNPNAKAASLLWFALFGTRNDGGAQMLGCSHKWITHTLCLFPKWIWLVKSLFWGIKQVIFCALLPSIVMFCKFKWSFMLILSLKITHLPCFKILLINPWKFHNQYWVKCTLNNPFIGLGSFKVRDTYWELINGRLWQLPTSLKANLGKLIPSLSTRAQIESENILRWESEKNEKPILRCPLSTPTRVVVIVSFSLRTCAHLYFKKEVITWKSHVVIMFKPLWVLNS
jgi:hypothetical protein